MLSINIINNIKNAFIDRTGGYIEFRIKYFLSLKFVTFVTDFKKTLLYHVNIKSKQIEKLII